MAILQGEYNLDDLLRHTYPDPDGTRHELNPERVKVTASPDEFARIGELPDAVPYGQVPTSYDVASDDMTYSDVVSIPPDRDLVQHIARRVEVQVPDENLVDWMRRGHK